MNLPAKFRSFWRSLFRKRQLDAEMETELRAHLELQTRENLEAGMSLEEARLAARRQFGHLDSIKEKARDQRGMVWLENFFQDLRQGTRMLRQNPGFTAAAVLTLALGIGATTAMFSVVNAVLLRPLPYHDPERLVWIFQNKPQRELAQWPIGAQKFEFWREHGRDFEELGLAGAADFYLAGEKSPELLRALRVTANLCDLLGVQPLLGRAFRPEECQPGAARVALLTHRTWQQRFAGNPGIVGKTIRQHDETFTVVGVLPPALRFPIGPMPAWRLISSGEPELWLPLVPHAPGTANGTLGFAIGRLKREVTLRQAQAGMAGVVQRYEETYPQTEGWSVELVPVHQQAAGQVRPALLLLFGAVGAVLLIACVNVANLLLARAMNRRKEFAIRAAVGAGRLRLVRQLLTESLLLGVLGGTFGILLAWWGKQALLSLSPIPLPRAEASGLDLQTLGFALLACLAAGVGAGLAPMWQAARQDLTALMTGAPGAAPGQSHRPGLRSSLVTLEVALSLVLLVSAGLLIRSFTRVLAVNTGYRPEHVLVMNLALASPRYASDEAKEACWRELLARVKGLPGVSAAGLSFGLPLDNGVAISKPFKAKGRAVPPGEDPYLSIRLRLVSPDYFAAMGIPLLSGIGFPAVARPPDGNAREIILNQAAAKKAYPGENPLGKLCNFGTIIGVVGDTLDTALDQSAGPQFYLDGGFGSEAFLVVRTLAAPETIKGAVLQQIATLDPDLPVHNVKTMEHMVADSLAPRRFQMTLLAIFAAAASLLALIGIHGVVAWSVACRTREIGIRMALGARMAEVTRLVVREGLRPVLTGIALGLFGALGAARILASQLFGVTTTDWPTFAGVALVTVFVAALACWLPARRAAKVNPMEALRSE